MNRQTNAAPNLAAIESSTEITPIVATNPTPTSIPPTQVELSIIIVSWNVWDVLRVCLASIEQRSRAVEGVQDARSFGPLGERGMGGRSPLLEVIVVDNASKDATVDLLPMRFPWVRLIRSADNLGFTKGNNVGYATSRGQTIYFLNPDTELVDTTPASNVPNTSNGDHADSSLWRLYQCLVDDPKVGMVGPLLRYGDYTIQCSRRHFPTRLTPFFESGTLGRYWPDNPWLRRFAMSDWPEDFSQEVDWLVGAAILAKRSVLEEVRQPDAIGPFDEAFFMYSEEVDLCNRIRRAGWRIRFIPDVTVIHYQGRSSAQVVATRDIHFYRSQILYHKKYFGERWALALRLFLLWNYRYLLLVEAGKWLLGHKRELRAHRVSVYRQVLATKLLPAVNSSPTITV